MKGCPFKYQRHGSSRELSPEDGERLYLNKSLVFAIFGVEMRRAVISKVFEPQSQKIGPPQAFLLLILPVLILPAPQAQQSRIGPHRPERGGLARARRTDDCAVTAYPCLRGCLVAPVDESGVHPRQKPTAG